VQNKYLDYILRELTEIAEQKYPNELNKQHEYILGFIASQLAQAIKDDNLPFNRFKQATARARKKR
jgi:hypothetical protein